MATGNNQAIFPLKPLAADDLLNFLTAHAGLDPNAAARAQNVAEETGQRVARILLQLGLLSERQLAQAYAEFLDLSVAPSEIYEDLEFPPCAERLSPRFLRHARCLPLAIEGQTLFLIMADPLDHFTRRSIEMATDLEVSLLVGVPVELEAAFNRFWPEDTERESVVDEERDGVEEDSDRLKDMASEAPVIRLVNQMIARAVETHASDIHVEPFENTLRIRYRYDGVLHEAETQPVRITPAVVSRIKIMAHLDIAERRLPQDGRIKLAVRGHEIDLRVSTVPSLYGESVVMRVLDRSTVNFSYSSLGLSPDITRKFQETLDLPDGIVLVTGPTGSGKTTTLYTGLSDINAETRKIITIEDPVEYQLGGITQLQVRPQIDLTFASLLRSILRQDPDVIMVGEIRDLETARIAVQAALTGHLVLSTLHTNSAASAVTRMRDMGLEDYLLSAVLRGVLAQRLVRRLCKSCRVQEEPEISRALCSRFNLQPREGQGFWRAAGCRDCNGTGYHGRLAIAEFLQPTPAVQRMILSGASDMEIEETALKEGMNSLLSIGLHEALSGETTAEEVLRVVRMEG
ncbi:type II secretion system protein GspE [Acetobacter sicerae]|nr:type II secretion system protein GspE [Acetobacter sicerae]